MTSPLPATCAAHDAFAPSGDASHALLRPAAALARRLLFAAGPRLRDGSLTVVEGASRRRFGAPSDLAATLYVHDPAFWIDAALGGSIGFGESYVRGRWSADDPTALVRLFVRNLELLDAVEGGVAAARRALERVASALRPATRARSRRDIAAHYDLGNDFFERVLDPTMSYSCARFDAPGLTLEEASRSKMEDICDKLALGPGDHLLEIGTGWGGLAEHAARRRGCRVTTTTISRAQREGARARIERAGLSDRVTVLDRDWRDLEGQHDALACVEMIEAVGWRHHDAFFRACRERLRPGKRMLLQAITIRDDRFERARDEVDFIKKHVFPGSSIPSRAALRATSARAGLCVVAEEDRTAHYPPTLRAWRQNLERNAAELEALGYSEALRRTWQFYLFYCEAGFLEGHIGDVQLLLERTG